MPTISLRRAAALLLPALVAAGCGGSGGGGSAAVTASILFPPGASLTDADVIRVRGTTSGAPSVTALSVNGVAAATTDGFATWSATVPLTTGDNALTVSFQDALGATHPAAATVNVRREGPVPQMLDSAVLVPSLGVIVATDPGAGLLSVNLATGARTLLSSDALGTGTPARSSPAPYAFGDVVVRAATGRAYVFDDVPAGERVLEVNLLNGNRSVISGATQGAGPALVTTPVGLALDAGSNRLFLGGFSNKVQQIDLATGDRTEVVSGVGSGQTVARTEDLDIDAPADVLYVFDSSNRALIAVDLVTLARTVVSGLGVGAGPTLPIFGELALDLAGGRAFVSDQAQAFRIDLASGDRTVISSSSVGTGPLLAGLCDLCWDAAGARLLAPRTTGGLLAVDPVTGDRTLLHEPTFGSGPLEVAEDLTPTADGRTLLFIDDPSGSAAALLALDLASGVRSLVAGATRGSGAAIGGNDRLAAAASSASVHVIDFGAVLRVDLATGDRTIVSDAVTGSGPVTAEMVDGVRRTLNDRLLVVSSDLGLLEVDPLTGQRTLMTSIAALGGSSSTLEVTYDAPRDLVYVGSDDGGDFVWRVDPVSPGAPPTLTCVGLGPLVVPPFLGDLDSLTFDAHTDALIVLLEGAQYLTGVNPQADTAAVLADYGANVGPILPHNRIQADPLRGVLYLSVGGGLCAVDAATGDRVLLALVGNRTRGHL